MTNGTRYTQAELAQCAKDETRTVRRIHRTPTKLLGWAIAGIGTMNPHLMIEIRVQTRDGGSVVHERSVAI